MSLKVEEVTSRLFNIWSNANLNRFILQNNDLTDNVITNYKINQPFTSDFSVEEGEKIPLALEIMEPAELSALSADVETFLTQRLEKSVEGKTYSRNTVKTNSFLAGQIFFPVPFKESRFPLFGISIQAGKRSSRSITERSCATGIDFFHNAARTQAFNFQQRP